MSIRKPTTLVIVLTLLFGENFFLNLVKPVLYLDVVLDSKNMVAASSAKVNARTNKQNLCCDLFLLNPHKNGPFGAPM
jgi:hypothetical protein